MKRRHLLLGGLVAGGGLALGWALMPPRQRLMTAKPPPTAAGQHVANGWLLLGEDDRITLLLPKSEMGQGVHTSLAMVAADELDARLEQIRIVHPQPDAIHNNLATVVDGLPFHPDDHGLVQRSAAWLTAKAMREFGLVVTGGSTSVKDLWLPLREAGASARAMLLAAAAQRWSVPVGECSAGQGLVRHSASGRSLRYGELAAAAATQPRPERPVLKTAAQFTLIGQPQPRLEGRAKSDGSARFGIDTRLPGQRYACVRMSPQLGGTLARCDPAPALAVAGVEKVVELPALNGASAGVAVVAATHWQALAGARALQPQWQPGPAAGLDSAAVLQRLRDGLGGGFAYFSSGDAEAALAGAARRVQAEYSAPMLHHAALEPMNCTVQLQPDGRATVWAPTQVPDLARRVAAEVLGLPREAMQMEVTLLGGGFGRRLEVDFIAQAAFVAKALPGVPVQTFWSREEDSTHDFYRPPCVARCEAGLDAQGRLLAWTADSASPSIVQQFLQRQFGLPGAGPDKTTAEGMFDQPYAWPAARVRHRIVELPLPVGFWRSVGHSHQAFFKESFMDELAHAAGQDPLAFRLALLQDHPRHAAVLQRAASLAGWGTPLAPADDGAKRARGLALHQSFGSIVAQVAEVSVDPAEPGRVRVHRVVAVIDCGTVVNPAHVRHQLEGSIVFGLSAALYGEATLADGVVQQSNFHQHRVLRLPECPQIDCDIIASTQPPEGVGEPGVPPVAPALANALFALTGQRLRSLPLRLAAPAA